MPSKKNYWKYARSTRKIKRTYPFFVCPLWLPVSSAVLGNGIPVMRRSQGCTPYDFDRCPHRGGLHLENPCDRQFFTQSFRSKIIALEKMSQFQNSPRIYTENERFPSGFPSSLRSSFFWCQDWTGLRKRLGSKLNFLSTRSSTVYAPYLPCDIRTQNWPYHAWPREDRPYTQASSEAVSSLVGLVTCEALGHLPLPSRTTNLYRQTLLSNLFKCLLCAY